MTKIQFFVLISIVIMFALVLFMNSTSNNLQLDSTSISDSVITSDKIIIAGIYRDGSKSVYINEGLSALNESKKLGAYEFIYIDGNNNEQDYMQGIDSIIDEEVDGVILCQPYESLSDEITDKLTKANIPFVSTNTPIKNIKGQLMAPIIGVDDYALGHMTGDWMANYTIKNGLIDVETVGLMLLVNNTLPNMESRKEGQINRFMEMIPYYDENKIYNVSYNGSTEDSLDKTLHILMNHLDITYWLVLATSDEGALGAVRGLEQLGMDSNASVVSIGGSVTLSEFKREYSALKASSYFSSSKIGIESARALYELINNNNTEYKETYFNAVIITKENYQEFVEDN